MKNFNKWINRYRYKFGEYEKITRQFNGEKYNIRFYQEGGCKFLALCIVDDGEEWDYGIFDCNKDSQEELEMMTFESFEDEDKLWDVIKGI